MLGGGVGNGRLAEWGGVADGAFARRPHVTSLSLPPSPRVFLGSRESVTGNPYFEITHPFSPEASSFLGQPWSPEAVSANFTICGLVERVGARLELGDYPLTR